jgi:dihydroneopterin aldolase
MFSVFLENQHVKAQVGWYQKERSQRVDLWISIYAGIKPENVREQLSHTLDYATLVGIVITESSKERKLLETLAADIVSAIEFANPGILQNIEVVIRKKHVDVTGYQADGAGVRYKKEFKS